MKEQELFNKTIDVLVRAYQNNTLKHGSCAACAVGNLVGHGMDYEIIKGQEIWFVNKNGLLVDTHWTEAFSTISGMQWRNFEATHLKDVREQIESTGYPVEVLADIEYAFETAHKGSSEDDWMFNGLLAVYDVLCKYHEVENAVPASEVFVKL